MPSTEEVEMQAWVLRAIAPWTLALLKYDPADEPSTRQVRAERHRELELRPLDPSVRQRYLLVWQELQEGFVDDPPETVRKAVDLVRRAMKDRGYPALDFELRLGRTNTEELRQAFLHYRSLFSELLERDRVTNL